VDQSHFANGRWTRKNMKKLGYDRFCRGSSGFFLWLPYESWVCLKTIFIGIQRQPCIKSVIGGKNWSQHPSHPRHSNSTFSSWSPALEGKWNPEIKGFKQCHKPPMTGNGLYLPPMKMVNLGVVQMALFYPQVIIHI
jgi:hypothetical protein